MGIRLIAGHVGRLMGMSTLLVWVKHIPSSQFLRYNRHHQLTPPGGHLSEEIQIPAGADIVKVEVGHDWHRSCFNGLRFHLSDGTYGGYLYGEHDVLSLGKPSSLHSRPLLTIHAEPEPNEKIVGFHGRTGWGEDWDSIHEFGIFTVPKYVELPEEAYDLEELKNTDGGHEAVSAPF
jgi:hypothetical protein